MDTDTSKQVQELYEKLLSSWNDNDARSFASLFDTKCLCVGFDGTVYESAEEISTELGKIFADHQVASYVHKIRSVTPLDEHTTLLYAVASMTPPGSTRVNPDRNAVQVLAARKINDEWRIVSFQNTPAKYDGRPEMVRALTEELQEELLR